MGGLFFSIHSLCSCTRNILYYLHMQNLSLIFVSVLEIRVLEWKHDVE